MPSIKTLHAFTREIGVSPATIWRWRRQGILETVNINGKPYITSEAAEQFVTRVAAGEFAKRNPVPAPPRAGAQGQ
jgi:hypothetical protein